MSKNKRKINKNNNLRMTGTPVHAEYILHFFCQIALEIKYKLFKKNIGFCDGVRPSAVRSDSQVPNKRVGCFFLSKFS